MKCNLFLALVFCAVALPATAQKYEIRFDIPQAKDSVLYIGHHYRDRLVKQDSAVRQNEGTFIFRGKRKWDTGIYALFNSEAKKSLMDFTIDGSQRFTMRLTSSYGIADPQSDITGSPANQAMYAYINRENQAKEQARDINNRKRSSDPEVKAQAEKEMEQLSQTMIAYEKEQFSQGSQYLFFRLANMFQDPEIPDEVEDKAQYHRYHYWDKVDFTDHSLLLTPNFFNRVNYYFFGILYHADMDTICRYADLLLSRIEDDTLMLRYVMDFIMPRYYRSTKNIGWDAVWCYLVRNYYLNGKCSWALPSELSEKRQKAEFLEKSLIGAIGQELYMADTNQSADPRDWISSHRFPQRFIILWFWDPDCHHCQEQTATLKELYDSLAATGNKMFEVYAVGFESDVAKWKRYVREHQLPFVNVGGPNVNIDYQEAYNVHGAPTMIILNEERRIIMNKVLPTKSIIPFLKKYEERHPLKPRGQH